MRPFLLLLAICTAHLAAEDWRVATLTPSSSGLSSVVLGLGDATRLDAPMGMVVLGDGSVVVVDTGLHSLVRISGGGRAQLLAGGMGTWGAADGTGAAARFNWPQFVAQAPDGTLVVSDSGNHTIRRVTLDGVVTTIAGSAGQVGSADGAGAAARFRNPAGVAVDGAGTIYVVDRVNATIRRIAADGAVTTLAGLAGSAGTSNGVGSAARFMVPYGVALAGSSLFITDSEIGVIRRLDLATAAVSTYAGQAWGLTWTDGDLTTARFKYPQGIAADPDGNLFVGDSGSSTIRRIDRSGAGSVATIAGNGSIGKADGVGAAARLFSPLGLAIGGDRRLYIADFSNHRLCRAAPAGAPLFLWIDGDAGATTGGGNALVHGANLAGLTAATLGGLPAALSEVSATSARVAIPAHATGLVDLTIAAGAITTTQTGAFRYLEATSIDAGPAKPASTLGDTELTFAGSRLNEVTAAQIGGASATIRTRTATSLVLLAPARAAGSADLVLTTPLGPVTASGAVLYLAPPALDPVAGRQASTLGGTTLAFSGRGLTAVTAVRAGGATATVSASTDTRLTIVAPAHAAGSADLEVDWALGTVRAADAVLYLSAPAVSATAAAIVDIAGGATLRFAGSSLDAVTSALLGGSPASILSSSDTSLVLRAPAHAAGSVDLELNWVVGTVTVPGAAIYRDHAAPVVTVTTAVVDPAGGTLTLAGSNLDRVTAARLGGVAATIISQTATSLVLRAPAHAAGSVDLALDWSGATVVVPGVVVYSPDGPRLDAGPAKPASTLGGTELTFAGSRLDQVTAAQIGGASATIRTRSATSLVLLAPARVAGSADLVLTCPLGTVTASGAVLYLAPPVLDAVTTRPASTLGGTALEFTGSGLGSATAARIGSATAAISANTGTRLTVVAPAHAAGSADLELDWALGTVRAAAAVDFHAPPAVSATAAAIVDIAGGATLRFAGSDLDAATAIRVGGTAATVISRSATSLVLRAPAHAAGSADLELDWVLGTVAVASAVLYRDPAAPVVTFTTAAIVDPAGGTLTLAGSNLDRVTAARLGGVAATIISQTATSLVLRAPAHAAGSVDLALDWGGSTVVVPGAVVYGTPPAPTPVLLPAAPAVGAMGGGGGGGGGCGLGGVGLLLGLSFMLTRRASGR